MAKLLHRWRGRCGALAVLAQQLRGRDPLDPYYEAIAWSHAGYDAEMKGV